MNIPDPLVSSTDAYVTAICYIGSKSLSHVLSCIEKQIIESVMQYWKDQPGIGVNIVDKLLNYTILSPASVVEWALAKEGSRLGEAHVFEMISATIGKVTGRVRQVVRARVVPGLLPEQKAILHETADRERKGMKDLFGVMENLLLAWASGSQDHMIASGDGSVTSESAMIKQWAERWLRVFRRKIAVEDAWFIEAGKEKAPEAEAQVQMDPMEENEDMTNEQDLP